MPRRPLREVYEGRSLLLPELRMIGWNSNRAARDSTLAEHSHRDAYEVCFIARGNVEWWAGRKTFQVGPGDVCVTQPNERHGGVNAVIQPCDLYWLQVAAQPEHAPELVRRLGRLRERSFPGAPAVGDALRSLLAIHRSAARGALAVHQARATLHTLLVHVILSHDAWAEQRRARDERVSPPIRRAAEWIEARLGEAFSITDAAAVSRLGPSQFHARFVREMGYSPADWRTRRRVDHAKQLLRSGDTPITSIAMRCGFGTSQYFATAFKNLVGLTPREYRERRALSKGG